jgi:pyruvate ferredoxin oxidoreductase alpha subunit
MIETRKVLDGNTAAVEAMKLARVQVIAAYPITPQSPIAEKLSGLVQEGVLVARYIRVESEHSALSCVIGAQLTGVRTATATSSVGLALMHEVLGVASGLRVPIVMPVVNRALVSPWSLWCDHQDSMAERDSGWLQFYVENAQETLDWTLMAYRIAEHTEVLTPAMVCMDGFYLSHASQPVQVPDQESVDRFLPGYQPTNLILDPNQPMFINDLTPPSEFSEMRFQQKTGFECANQIIPQVLDAFMQHFGRQYSVIEAKGCQDARAVLVTLGSVSGTAKYVASKLRSRGLPVGVLKLSVFRPFPAEAVRDAIGHIPSIGVLDRSAGLGAESGPLCLEIRSALRGKTHVQGYVAGLGGRDITEQTLEQIFMDLLEKADREEIEPSKAIWMDTRPDAMDLRRVEEA